MSNKLKNLLDKKLLNIFITLEKTGSWSESEDKTKEKRIRLQKEKMQKIKVRVETYNILIKFRKSWHAVVINNENTLDHDLQIEKKMKK